MKSLSRRLPSPSMSVALVALFVALGGTSYAVATGSIDSREIKNNDVRTKDLKNNDVRGSDIRTGAVTGGDVAANTLTGADIVESSLGAVPQAAAAGTANTANTANSANTVGGVAVRRVDFRRNATLASTPFFSMGGLTLSGACTPGDVAVTASSSAAAGTATIRSIAHDSGAAGPSVNPVNSFIGGATSVDLLAVDDDDVIGQTVYQRINGSVVVINWMTDDGVSAAEPDCTFVGTATQY